MRFKISLLAFLLSFVMSLQVEADEVINGTNPMSAQNSVIEPVDYQNKDELSTYWIPRSTSPETILITDGSDWNLPDEQLIEFPLVYVADETYSQPCDAHRCYWDLELQQHIDINGHSKIETDIYIDDPEAISHITFYIHIDGAGWYYSATNDFTQGWNTVSFDLPQYRSDSTGATDLSREKLQSLNMVRFSPWRKSSYDQNSFILMKEIRVVQEPVAVLKSESKYFNDWVSKRLRDYGIQHQTITQQQLSNGFGDDKQLIIIPEDDLTIDAQTELEQLIGTRQTKVISIGTDLSNVENLAQQLGINTDASQEVASVWIADADPISPEPYMIGEASWHNDTTAMIMPIDFATRPDKMSNGYYNRCFWDRYIPEGTLDLSQFDMIELDMYVENPEPIRNFTLYFNGNNGTDTVWNSKTIQLSSNPGEHTTYSFDISHIPDEYLSDVRVIRFSPWNREGYNEDTILGVTQLRAVSNTEVLTIDDFNYANAIEPDSLCFNDGITELDEICYPISSQGSIKRFLVDEEAPSPATSIADIIGTDGNTVFNLGWTINENGAYTPIKLDLSIHEFTNPTKEFGQILAQLVGELLPYKASSIAQSALSHSTKIGQFESYSELSSYLRTNLDSSPFAAVVLGLLDQAELKISEFQMADSAEQIRLAYEIKLLLEEAYQLHQSDKGDAVEFRGMWEESGFGVFDQDWEQTMVALRKSGINAIVQLVGRAASATYADPMRYQITNKSGLFVDQLEESLRYAQNKGIAVHAWTMPFLEHDAKLEGSSLPGDLKNMIQKEIYNADVGSKTVQVRPIGFDKYYSWLSPCVDEIRDLAVERNRDIADRYNVSGIHLDYIRYSGLKAGYEVQCKEPFIAHLSSVHNIQVDFANWPADLYFNSELNKKYQDWKASLVTDIVRRTYEEITAINAENRPNKPHIILSAAVFADIPAANSFSQYWNEWVNEGIIDQLNPMSYTTDLNKFDQYNQSHQEIINGQIPFYPGIGSFINPPDQVIAQINMTRQMNTGGFTLYNLSEESVQMLLPVLAQSTTTSNGLNTYDTDQDGISDVWEAYFGLDPNNSADAVADLDGDGLTNIEEFSLATNPTKQDADADPDQDGLTNIEELSYQTNAFNHDSDNDGYLDGEDHYPTNPEFWFTRSPRPEKIIDGTIEPIFYETFDSCKHMYDRQYADFGIGSRDEFIQFTSPEECDATLNMVPMPDTPMTSLSSFNQALLFSPNTGAAPTGNSSAPFGIKLNDLITDFNPNSGTISFWVKSNYDPKDDYHHTFVSFKQQPFINLYGYEQSKVFQISEGWFADQTHDHFNYFYEPKSASIYHSQLLQQREWNQVTMTWSLDNQNKFTTALYLNGEIQQSITSKELTATDYNGDLIVPKAPINGVINFGSDYNGQRSAEALLDELVIYDQALSSDQVEQLYSSFFSTDEDRIAHQWPRIDEQPSLKTNRFGQVVENRILYDEGSQDELLFVKWGAEELLDKMEEMGFNVYVPVMWNGSGTRFKSSYIDPVVGRTPFENWEPTPPWAAESVNIDYSKFYMNGSDMLQEFISKAHERGIEVHTVFSVHRANYHQFVKKESSPKYPSDWIVKLDEVTEDGVTYRPTLFNIKSTGYRNYMTGLMRDFVKRYPVDGIVLDYIRSGVKNSNCHTSECIDQFLIDENGDEHENIAIYSDYAAGCESGLPKNFSDASRYEVTCDSLESVLNRMAKTDGNNTIDWWNRLQDYWVPEVYHNWETSIVTDMVRGFRTAIEEQRPGIAMHANTEPEWEFDSKGNIKEGAHEGRNPLKWLTQPLSEVVPSADKGRFVLDTAFHMDYLKLTFKEEAFNLAREYLSQQERSLEHAYTKKFCTYGYYKCEDLPNEPCSYSQWTDLPLEDFTKRLKFMRAHWPGTVAIYFYDPRELFFHLADGLVEKEQHLSSAIEAEFSTPAATHMHSGPAISFYDQNQQRIYKHDIHPQEIVATAYDPLVGDRTTEIIWQLIDGETVTDLNRCDSINDGQGCAPMLVDNLQPNQYLKALIRDESGDIVIHADYVLINTWFEAYPSIQFSAPGLSNPMFWHTSNGQGNLVYDSVNHRVLFWGQTKDDYLSSLRRGNSVVGWSLQVNQLEILDVANYRYDWGVPLEILEEYATDPAPILFNAHNSFAFDPVRNELVMMMGNHTPGSFANETTELAYDLSRESIWRFSLDSNRWTAEESDHIVSIARDQNYENHLIYMPTYESFMYLDALGDNYAWFDPQIGNWVSQVQSNSIPIEGATPYGGDLYKARSTWDSQRQRVIFRNATEVFAFDSSTGTYIDLPNIDMQYSAITYIAKHDVYLAVGPEIVDTNNGCNIKTAIFNPTTNLWEELASAEYFSENCLKLNIVYDQNSDKVALVENTWKGGYKVLNYQPID